INKKQNEALELSKLIVELIEIEILENIKIGISSLEPAINIKKLYDESIDSIKLSDEFKLEGNIYRYNELFIYKTISLIDDDNITYISRYIDKYNMKNLNKDEIKTARKFLDYSLNISEAAKNLYIHRNTLIYRLDKIKKITGMDLRNFDDSLKFKILLIIHNHINYTLRK
ncbi:MAG: PucR family transcriptional regulator, partial [Senegalia sp. (in: firmicutes)]